MLIDKEKRMTNAHLKRLARELITLSEERRKHVLSSIPSDDRTLLIEMVKSLQADRPLLKG